MISFALGIPHAPWMAERPESLMRLLQELGLNAHGAPVRVDASETCMVSRIFDERAANHEWSEAMWRWGAEQGESHFVTLQDDARVAPNFWAAVRAMVEAVPDQVIGLEVVHPSAPALAREGEVWFTTSDCLVGVGYVFPTELLREFLRWRTELAPGVVESVNEDTLIAVWCVATGRRIWHPIPTIIDHDVSLASTYANDAHGARRPSIRWDSVPSEALEMLEDPEFWKPGDIVVPHLGRFPDWTVPALALKIGAIDSAAYTRAMQDDGSSVLRPLALRARAARLGGNVPRIYVAQPIGSGGGIEPACGASMWRLMLSVDAQLYGDWDIDRTFQQHKDIIRARSCIVRRFLESNCTHLLFIDADISFDPIAVHGMIASGRDIVGCPYPARTAIRWDQVAKPTQEDALARPSGEARAYPYVLALKRDAQFEDGNLLEVEGVPLGLCLISRECCEKMAAHYGRELEAPEDAGDRWSAEAMKLRDGYGDIDRAELSGVFARAIAEDRAAVERALVFTNPGPGEPPTPTVALFHVGIKDKHMPSEDYAFCRRWRAIGGKVYAYLGKGSPVNHHGKHMYRGMIEALGLRREEA
jgi:hypothetical protein